MIITTSGRPNEYCYKVAKEIASIIDGTFVERKKRSVSSIQKLYNESVLVIGKERFELYHREDPTPLFFHPNTASFRVKRLVRGEDDPFVQATNLKKGMTFLDATLGLASDSIVASYLVGDEGTVIGVEENKLLALLVEKGLKMWNSEDTFLIKAMGNIQVVTANHYDYLKTLEDNSIDVIYFDPMFESEIEESNGIRGIKSIATYDTITIETIKEAMRVVRERVVIKDHFKSARMDELGFTRIVRKTSLFHYGVMIK